MRSRKFGAVCSENHTSVSRIRRKRMDTSACKVAANENSAPTRKTCYLRKLNWKIYMCERALYVHICANFVWMVLNLVPLVTKYYLLNAPSPPYFTWCGFNQCWLQLYYILSLLTFFHWFCWWRNIYTWYIRVITDEISRITFFPCSNVSHFWLNHLTLIIYCCYVYTCVYTQILITLYWTLMTIISPSKCRKLLLL